MSINVTYFLFVIETTNVFNIVDKIDIINDVSVTNKLDTIIAIKFNVEVILKNVAKATTFNFRIFLI